MADSPSERRASGISEARYLKRLLMRVGLLLAVALLVAAFDPGVAGGFCGHSAGGIPENTCHTSEQNDALGASVGAGDRC